MLYDKFTAEEKLILARKYLIENQPFFGFLCMHIKFIKVNNNSNVKTVSVNSLGEVFYEEKYINSLDKSELIITLVHEILHVSLNHFIRKGTRDTLVWNYAIDYAVNDIISKCDLNFKKSVLMEEKALTRGWLYSKKYENMSSEEIYELLDHDEIKKLDKLMEEMYKNENENENENIILNDKHSYEHTDKNEKEIQKIESKWNDKLLEAYEYSKNIGTIPSGIKIIVEGFFKQKLNYKTIIYKYINRSMLNNYTWSKPARSTYVTKVYLPGVLKENINVVVAIDTSGSINREKLKQFKSELYAIKKSFSNITIDVIMHDCEIQDHIKIKNSSKELKEFKGRGGTRHDVVFEYIEKEIKNVNLIICLTDGYTIYPKKVRNKNVLWIFSSNKKTAPFGQVIHI